MLIGGLSRATSPRDDGRNLSDDADTPCHHCAGSGDRRPTTDVRLEMLEEALGVMRLLWEGGVKDRNGKHYTVENIRQAAEAGYDEVYVQQIGPEQGALFRFYEKEVLPKMR